MYGPAATRTSPAGAVNEICAGGANVVTGGAVRSRCGCGSASGAAWLCGCGVGGVTWPGVPPVGAVGTGRPCGGTAGAGAAAPGWQLARRLELGLRLDRRRRDQRWRSSEAEILIGAHIYGAQIARGVLVRANDTRRQQHDDVGLRDDVVTRPENASQHRDRS